MKTHYSTSAKLKAWLVHGFTATGIITVFMALVAAGKADFRAAMLWLIAAQLIDGVDGTLARRYQVEKVLPQMSGKSIDFVIDFAGYAIVPAFIIYKAGLMPDALGLSMAFLILLTSAIYYGKSGMISENHYFVGFPVMWNMVAFYLIFIFPFPPYGHAAFILALAALQFAPVKFAYPSRTKRWRPANLLFTGVFVLSVTGLLWWYPDYPRVLYWASLASLGYFAVFAIVATFVYRD
jgi:phosphatidylcholine synthase